MLWAEVAPAPGLQGRAGGQLSLHEGQPAFCPLLPASPRKPSWPHVHLVSLPCSSCAPHVPRAYLPRGTEACGGVGGGQGHRKRLVGACGPGRRWQPPQEERTFRGWLRSLHCPLLPPPSLTPSFKGEGHWAGGGGGGTEACRVSSLPPGTLWRAERAMALDSQAPAPAQPPQWPVSSISL